MGSGRRDRHTASLDSAGSTTGGAAASPRLRSGFRLERRPCRSGTNVRRKFLARKSTSPTRRQPRSHLLISLYGAVKRLGPLFWVSDYKQEKSSLQINCTHDAAPAGAAPG